MTMKSRWLNHIWMDTFMESVLILSMLIFVPEIKSFSSRYLPYCPYDIVHIIWSISYRRYKIVTILSEKNKKLIGLEMWDFKEVGICRVGCLLDTLKLQSTNLFFVLTKLEILSALVILVGRMNKCQPPFIPTARRLRDINFLVFCLIISRWALDS